MLMAMQAGLLNVGGFMACRSFVSHVTGFATLFGMNTVEKEWGHAFGMLIVPLFFLFGSMISGVFVDLRLKLHQRPRYTTTFGIISALLIAILVGGLGGQFGEFGQPVELSRNYLLLILLCLVCGIQNGTVAIVSKSVVRTTHLTGITTDLGIGLVRVIHSDKLAGEIPNEGKANWMRIGIIFFFGLGSVIGAYLFSHVGYAGFALPALTSGGLLVTMFYFQVMKGESGEKR
jgi:uncharacterized membrane protein YoaK (UPF0700 family)